MRSVPTRSLLPLILAATAAAQTPRFELDVRVDPGQQVWIALAPSLAPAQQLPGVEGVLRLAPQGLVLFPAAPPGPGGRSRNPVPSFAFARGLRWGAQLVAFDAGGAIRLTRPYRVDGLGVAGSSATTEEGMQLDIYPVPDGPDDPRQAAVDHSLATGDTTFHLDARRNPVLPQREPGRRGALASVGPLEGTTDMSSLSLVSGSMTAFPYSATVKLFASFPGASGVIEGSGILIDPDHVLTAGHCAYDKDTGGYADKIWIVPGYSATGAATAKPWNVDMSTWGGLEPFGHSDVVDVRTWSEWRNSKTYKHDLAVLELNRPVGALAGWMGIDYSNDCDFYKNNTFYVRGYPSASPYTGARMYEQSGDFDGCPTRWEARFDLLSYAGSSGSGFYDYDAGDRWVHGVLSHAPGLYPNKTDAVRMRDEKYDDVRDWMNDHRGTVADLTPLAARFDDAVYGTPPTSVTRGSSYAFEFTCLNYSRVSRSGTLSYKYRISTDDTITGDDTWMDTVTKTNVPIGALETIDLHDTVTIPTGIGTGTRYIGVILTTTDARSGNQHTLAQDVIRVTVN